MTTSDPIAQLFYNVAIAVDTAHEQLDVETTGNISALNTAIAHVFHTMDQLITRLSALPDAARETYRPALTHVLGVMEQFDVALLDTRADIADELKKFNTHQRAFMAYLTTPSIKS